MLITCIRNKKITISFPKNKYLIAILGPTAVGKTNLSIQLAKALKTIIISCDSRQFFREMTIGTAKPTAEELASVPHRFINTHSIFDSYSVGDFERDALMLLDELFKKHQAVLMVGGSGLYLKAVVEGLDKFPSIPNFLRKQINEQYQSKGIAYLQEQIKTLDPTYYQEVDHQNPQRLLRALEVCLGTGKPFSSFHNNKKAKRSFTTLKIGLNMERNLLYERINKRVDQMMIEGLLEEAQKLYAYRHLNSLQTVGYQELFRFFDGEIDLSTTVELIKRNTRRYAKRQLTWFRRDKSIHWFDENNRQNILGFIQKKIKNN